MKNLAPDVTVIGAGPVGCVTALAFAHKGADVVLLEATNKQTRRFAGEWLHPPALKVLKHLNISLDSYIENDPNGQGFVVFAEDITEPIYLHYPDGLKGFSCEHNRVIASLRAAVCNCKNIDFRSNSRVRAIQQQQLSVQDGQHRELFQISTQLIVGADGRSSIARRSLNIPHTPKLISYMAGVLLENVELPFEGFGHVLLGGLGPVLAYRIGQNQVRLCLDVPINFCKQNLNLWEAYRNLLPGLLLDAFQRALEKNQVVWAANQYSSRIHYGRPGLALVGDATGYFHPITATGMTVGFLDAACLADSKNFAEYQRQRNFGTYVPEMLATTLYEVFCRGDTSAVSLRHAIYQMWQQDPQECVRTMQLLSGDQTNVLEFGQSFLKGVAIALKSVIKEHVVTHQWRQLLQVLVAFMQWLQLPMLIALTRFRWQKKRTT